MTRALKLRGGAVLVVIAVILLAAGSGSHGQEAVAPAAGLTLEAVEGHLEAVGAAKDLPEEQTGRLKISYEKAVAALKAAAEAREAVRQFRAAEDAAPTDLEAIDKRLASLVEAVESGELVNAGERALPSEELQALLQGEEVDLIQTQGELRGLNTDLAQSAQRPVKIPEESSRLQEELSLLEGEVQPEIEDNPLSADFADAVLREANIQSLRARLEALEAERVGWSVRQDVGKARKELLEKQVSFQNARVAVLRGLVRKEAAGLADEAVTSAKTPSNSA